MFQPNIINQALDWERRLEIEDEQRKNGRSEPYVNFLAPVMPCRSERRSILAWILRLGKGTQPACSCIYPQEPCCQTQPG